MNRFKTFLSDHAASQREELPVWHPSMRLVDLTGSCDWLTLSDVCSGLAAFGASGSGKTSSMALIAFALMKIQAGFVWLCVKPQEVELATSLAKAAGRAADVVVLGENANGVITSNRFNPLAYEASIPTTSTSSLVSYLSAAAKVLSRKEGERAAAEGERFWDDQFGRLMYHCIDSAKLAGRDLSIELLRSIQLSAAKTPTQLEDVGWKEKSVCWQCLKQAEARLDAGEIDEKDFGSLLDFWLVDYLNLDPEPRSSIDVMFAVLTDAFTKEEPVRTLLNSSTTVTPDDVMNDGKIVILSLPVNVYHGPGRLAQFCFKYSFQRAMLRRRKPQDGSFLRPCCLWLDEAHSLVHAFDASYCAECRSSRGVTVFIDQGVGGYMRALGMNHPDEVDGFLQNLTTKCFFQNQSPQTNLFAADAVGRVWTDKTASSFSTSLDGAHIGQTLSQDETHQIISGAFGHLRRGGAENDKIVDCYVLKASPFKNGSNVALCSFEQSDLTR